VPLFTFFSALTLIDIYRDASLAQRLKIRLRLFKYTGNLRRWSRHCPQNFRHKYLLIKAEMACLRNNPNQATSTFNAALQIAADNGYTQDIALIHERYGQYFLRHNWQELATPHLRKAWELYHHWGAFAKTEEMESRYDMVDFSRGPEPSSVEEQQSQTVPAGGHATVSPYDAAAIIKATHTLTEMIFEDDFLKKLMEIMIEIAGAQKGVLLFPKGNSWEGRLQGRLTDNGIHIKPLVQYRKQNIYSANIVRYVARTHENVVLNNASDEGLFTQDGYVVRYRPRSILCTPVIHQGRISCIVYLENNITSGAFPPERQEIIHLLGSHAAISLKNSNLYNELEAMVERLHQEIGKHKATQLQLLQSEKQAALGRLSASIAHEFGNPLIGIQYLFKDIIDRFELSEDDRKLIEIGLKESRRMKSMIQDMQQLNRPSSGKKTVFDPHKTLDNILLFQKKNLTSNNIGAICKYGKNVGKIHAVEDQITQVLVNITLNAVDAMKENGGTLTILTGEDDGSLNIVIMDTGKGISEEDQKNIFEPFFSTKTDVEGTGLGLPVSYSIIKEHGGDISFVSSPGKGSQFHIRLPLEQQAMPHHFTHPTLLPTTESLTRI
jgi:signal transduction histidine kinase